MAKNSTRNRWIMYAQQSGPAGMFPRVTCHESLDWCLDSLKKYARDVHTDNVSASLYAYDDESWRQARNFQDVGCPFDYPDKLIERGPKGAFRVTNA